MCKENTMKRLVPLFLIIAILFSFSACGGSSKTLEVTGDVVSASIPTDWCLISGTEMNGANGSDFICHTKRFEIGDPYLQMMHDPQSRSIEDLQAFLESEEVYGKYFGSFECSALTWYIAEKAAGAAIEGKNCVVLSYECDMNSDEVRAILGSLAWAD